MNDESVPLDVILNMCDAHDCFTDHYIPAGLTGKAVVEYLTKIFAECDKDKATNVTADDIKLIQAAFEYWDAKVGRDAYNTPHLLIEGWQHDVNEYQAAAFRKMLGQTDE